MILSSMTNKINQAKDGEYLLRNDRALYRRFKRTMRVPFNLLYYVLILLAVLYPIYLWTEIRRGDSFDIVMLLTYLFLPQSRCSSSFLSAGFIAIIASCIRFETACFSRTSISRIATFS